MEPFETIGVIFKEEITKHYYFIIIEVNIF